jgi:ribosomal protein S27AE
MVEQTDVVYQYRRQSLIANVARRCPHCGAPGFWHDVEGVNPGCYDPRKKMEALARYEGFAPVGRTCPQCGNDRDDVEPHGEIWSKVWRGPTIFERLRNKLTQWRFW